MLSCRTIGRSLLSCFISNILPCNDYEKRLNKNFLKLCYERYYTRCGEEIFFQDIVNFSLFSSVC